MANAMHDVSAEVDLHFDAMQSVEDVDSAPAEPYTYRRGKHSATRRGRQGMLALDRKLTRNLARSQGAPAAAISLVVANGGRALRGGKCRIRLRRCRLGLVVVAFVLASVGCARDAGESTRDRPSDAPSARVPTTRSNEIPPERSLTPAVTSSEPPQAPPPQAPRSAPDSTAPVPWWRRVLESGDPAALTSARHAPESEASSPGDEQGIADPASPDTQDGGTTAKPATEREPTAPKLNLRVLNKGPTYCTWSYYTTQHYFCTDADVSTALRRCSDYVVRRFGKGMTCFCTRSEGYAPQCTGKAR